MGETFEAVINTTVKDFNSYLQTDVRCQNSQEITEQHSDFFMTFIFKFPEGCYTFKDKLSW